MSSPGLCRAATLPVRFWSEFAWACHLSADFGAEEKAIEDWQRFFPGDVNVVRTMTRCLNRQQRPADALAFALGWNAAHPKDAWGWRYLADQHHAVGDAAADLAAMETACGLAGADPRFVDFKLMVLRRNGRVEAALACGQDWVTANPSEAHAELLNRIGLAADDLQRWPEAENFYQRAHLKEPAGPVWFGNFIRARIMLRQYGEAADLCRDWLGKNGWDNYVAGKHAWALREAGRRAEETEILRRAVEVEPKDEELNYDLLNSLIAQNLTAEAGELLGRTQREGVATGRFFNDWGNHLRDLRRFDEAEKSFRQALEISPHNQTAAGNLALLLTHCDRIDEATRYCQEWLARRPEDDYVRRQLAHAWYTADDAVLAEPEYRRLLKKDPDSIFLQGRLVACLRLAGRHADVLADGDAWLAAHEGDAFIFTEIGIAAGYLERPEDALAYFERALVHDASWYGAALRKMRLLDAQGDLMKAIQFGEAWTERHTADAGFQNELGILLDRAGLTEKAVQRFRRAVELDDSNPTLAANAVEILCRQNQLRESIQVGQRLLEKSPPNAYFLRRLAEAYSQNHEHMPALDLLETADVLEPGDVNVARTFLRVADAGDDPDRGIGFGRVWLARPGNERDAGVWAHLARLLFAADQSADAFKAIETAESLEPEQIRHARTRFSFLFADGDTSRLLAVYEKLPDAWRPDPVLTNYASQSYHNLGLENEAFSLAELNAKSNPDDGDVAAWLATLHRKRGRTEAAQDWIARWVAVHGDHTAVVKVRAGIALEQARNSEALKDAELLLVRDNSDEEAFVLRIRAMRALGRRDEVRSQLHQWIEHQKQSSRITRLLDGDSSDDPWGNRKPPDLGQ